MNHTFFMHRCLELAALGRKAVGNGALVGAMLVHEGKCIAVASYKKYGDSHAERILVQKFDQKISSKDILYVNLEPCCHTGKTPPCTDIILESAIKHVVVGMLDPDPRASGQGIALLRKNGVTVEGPVLRSECEWLNRGFISVRTHGRPWITLKLAQTPDGRIANSDGSPLAITSKEQDTWTHSFLRAKHDAVLVGVRTVITDNPILNARFSENPAYKPWRIILDPQARVPHNARVVTDDHASSTIVITYPEHAGKLDALKQSGVHVFTVQQNGDAFDWKQLWNVLLSPSTGFDGITSILVEGGAKTWESFRKEGCVDMEVNLVGSR